jgi:hypothetical protein
LVVKTVEISEDVEQLEYEKPFTRSRLKKGMLLESFCYSVLVVISEIPAKVDIYVKPKRVLKQKKGMFNFFGCMLTT